MLYETLAQPYFLAVLVVLGFLCGFLYDLRNLFFQVCKCNKIAGFVLDFVFTLFVGGILFWVVLEGAFGALRLWHVLVFASAVMLQRASCGHLLAKKLELCYTFLIKKLKNKRKLK